jgi:DNA-binding transcriptional regulator YiaG
MRRWKEDVRGIGGLDYIVFQNVPMRESKWGDVVELKESIMEKVAAEALIIQRFPLRGREVKFLRKALGLTYEKFATELGVSPSTVCKWEQKPDERLHIFNEAALRAFFAEKLGIEISGKLSQLIASPTRPDELVLKAS